MKAPATQDEAIDEAMAGQVLRRSELADVVKNLSRLKPSRSIIAVIFQWSVIAAVAGAATSLSTWWVYIPAVIVIATRQHALGILMHEGAHYRLLRNRRMNDWLSDWACAFPMAFSTEAYRKKHFSHHRWVNTEADPDLKGPYQTKDWELPATPLRICLVLVQDLIGWHAPMIARIGWDWSPFSSAAPRSTRVKFLCAFLCLAIVLTILPHGWLFFLLLWIVPYMTFLTVIFRVRAWAEHYCVESSNELNSTRTVLPTIWERFLLVPCNVNYHIEHHLYPSVPFYNLPALHRILMKNQEFQGQAHVNHGYFRGGAEVCWLTSRAANPEFLQQAAWKV